MLEIIYRYDPRNLSARRLSANLAEAVHRLVEGNASIDYAVHHLADSVRVVVVLGHSGCGAVSAAVDTFLSPSSYLDFASSFPLRSIVDRILVAVRVASRRLGELHGAEVSRMPGYREALVDLSVIINAAFGAYSIREELARSLRGEIRVVYGVYDLTTRRVRTATGEATGLAEPPPDPDGFRELLRAAAGTVDPTRSSG